METYQNNWGLSIEIDNNTVRGTLHGIKIDLEQCGNRVGGSIGETSVSLPMDIDRVIRTLKTISEKNLNIMEVLC